MEGNISNISSHHIQVSRTFYDTVNGEGIKSRIPREKVVSVAWIGCNTEELSVYSLNDVMISAPTAPWESIDDGVEPLMTEEG